ncbi:MAG TPA: OmpA family protein [Kofleriaceae bacterium]|nr:OmpA family protein [Kofleriaceae bacterium]
MATTTTPSTPTTARPRTGPASLARTVTGGLLLVAALFSVKQYAPGLFGGKKPAAPSSVPPRADLPSGGPAGAGAGLPAGAPPASAEPGCAERPEVRMLIWAWNAQQGLLLANGGPRAAQGSLMCERGVNLTLTRQDQSDQMQAALLKCAGELAAGKADCEGGAHFVAIMGDGAGAFFAALNPQLAKVCPDCTAEVIGSAGYSRGEDKFMGLPAWKQRPAEAAGALIAGYLRDGDWNIAMKWAGDNAVCNNPDETTYDPDCLNWVATADYLDAAAKYVAGYCEERPVVAAGTRTGRSQRVCVNGVVTWTPGDVNVARERGGLVSIASTKEYAYQMPNVVIGLRRWDRGHRREVVGLLRAMTDGGQAVKQSAAARQRAAEISAAVYGEQDAAYWGKYASAVVERDATGQLVELGGSAVSNLADNLHLFGPTVERSIFAATYTVFGNIVVHYYPRLVPSVPPVADVVDVSYLQEAAAAAPAALAAPADVPVYRAADPREEALAEGRGEGGANGRENGREIVGRRSWMITFEPGSDRFTAGAAPVLEELYRQTVVTRTVVAIAGHTDADGDAEANRELSRRRALAVRGYLMQRAPVSFPEARFRTTGHGEDMPVAANDTSANKARNRRVEIELRAQ